MKVKELIEQLKKYDDNDEVIIEAPNMFICYEIKDILRESNGNDNYVTLVGKYGDCK